MVRFALILFVAIVFCWQQILLSLFQLLEHERHLLKANQCFSGGINSKALPPFATGCGRAEPLPRLIRGKRIRRTQVPWIVRIISSPLNQPYQLLCGGSIITRRVILTAAHCVEKPIEAVRVFYNTSKLHNGPSVRAKAVIIHPEYQENMVSSDIALLKLEIPLRFDRFVRPVCLPTKWTRIKQQHLIVAGWGTTREGGLASEDLLHVRLSSLPSRKCKKLIPGSTAASINISTIICAWTKNKDICDGDSGGPLTGLNRKGKAVQLGVAAFNYACASPRTPTAFTRVSSFMPWIRRAMRFQQCWEPLDTTQELRTYFTPSILTEAPRSKIPLFESTCVSYTGQAGAKEKTAPTTSVANEVSFTQGFLNSTSTV